MDGRLYEDTEDGEIYERFRENGEGYMAWQGVRRTAETLITMTDTHTGLLDAFHAGNLI